MLAAARGLADFVPKEKILEEGKIYPEACELRTVAATVRFASHSGNNGGILCQSCFY